jgi:hypothetical protein
MIKWFQSLPAVLEQYNPEDKFNSFNELETFDENGKYHSYNDEPSLVVYDGNGKLFCWHSHGEIFREDDKPASIRVSPVFYRTYDANNNLHSYDGMPSVINIIRYSLTKTITAGWLEHGIFHRTGDLPAEITTYQVHGQGSNQVEKPEESYFEHGVFHRANNKPARKREHGDEWHVLGHLHNDKGIAIGLANNHESVDNEWALFGVRLTQEDYQQIKSFQHRRRAPLWLSFLYVIGLVDYTQVTFVLNKTNNFEALPINWVLHMLGLTDMIYNEHITTFSASSTIWKQETPSLKAIEEITEFNKQS